MALDVLLWLLAALVAFLLLCSVAGVAAILYAWRQSRKGDAATLKFLLDHWERTRDK